MAFSKGACKDIFHTTHYSRTGVSKLFYKEPYNKYVRVCGPFCLCPNHSTLPFWESQRQYIGKRARLLGEESQISSEGIGCQPCSRTLPFPVKRWHLSPLFFNLGRCVICLWPRDSEGSDTAGSLRLHQKRWCNFRLTPWGGWALCGAPSHHRSCPVVLRLPCCKEARISPWRDHKKKPRTNKKIAVALGH